MVLSGVQSGEKRLIDTCREEVSTLARREVVRLLVKEREKETGKEGWMATGCEVMKSLLLVLGKYNCHKN